MVRWSNIESTTPRTTSMPPEPTTQPYPGGDDHPAYTFAFQVWVVLFLGIICVGLLNFIALWWRNKG
jgi:hypothetical protein